MRPCLLPPPRASFWGDTGSDSACITLQLPLKRPACCAANSTYCGSCYVNQGYNYSVSAALGAVPDQLWMQTRSCWVCWVSSLSHCMLWEDRCTAYQPSQFKSTMEMESTLVVEIVHLTFPLKVIFFKWLLFKQEFLSDKVFLSKRFSGESPSEPLLNCNNTKVKPFLVWSCFFETCPDVKMTNGISIELVIVVKFVFWIVFSFCKSDARSKLVAEEDSKPWRLIPRHQNVVNAVMVVSDK